MKNVDHDLIDPQSAISNPQPAIRNPQSEIPNPQSSPPPLTVSQVTARIKKLFENDEFRAVRVVGEISNFKHHLGKHMYFRLKDSGAQIACAFYHPANSRLAFVPRDGIEVVVNGYVSVYEGRGEYQLYVRAMEQSGLGALYAKLETLKKKLREEGLTAPERKRPLPAFPKRIGIVASAESAGLQDMLKALRRRYPLATVVLEPVAVEGEASAPSIAAGLGRMAALGNVDVVITGRGGGSIESLWGFNTEIVARAIVAMPVPVITAVGHETDTTLADLVADRRAITPTEAIELATPSCDELRIRVRELGRLAQQRAWKIRGRLRDLLQHVARALRSPEAALARRIERLGRAEERMGSALTNRLASSGNRALGLARRVDARSPERVLRTLSRRLESARGSLGAQKDARLTTAGRRIEVIAARLAALNPTAVLARGYAVVLKDGHAVRRADELAVGDALSLRLHEGQVDAAVIAATGGSSGRGRRRSPVASDDVPQLGLFESKHQEDR